MQFGELIPVTQIPVLPGDSIKIGCDSLIRFMPLVTPVMHRMDVTVHYFFVPNRIVFDQWEEFIANEGVAAPYTTMNTGASTAKQRTASYYGVPKVTDVGGGTDPVNINALPFAAYNKIYNDYYRDQNLQAEAVDSCVAGFNHFDNYDDIHKRNFEHDYFTSCLPWAQKGTAVDIPLGDVQLKSSWVGDGASPFFTNGTINPPT